MSSVQDHWGQHAQGWSHVGSPLRPIDEDLRIMRHLVGPASGRQLGDVLILGATPELSLAALHHRGRQYAVDRSIAMLRRLRPQGNRQDQYTIQGNWTALPLADSSIDCALGDGCLTVLESTADYHRLCQELQRVLRPGGRVLLRIFVRPEHAESREAVIEDLMNGTIGSFHAFKWRLAMALQASLSEGIPVRKIWEGWRAMNITPTELARRTGWQEESIRTIDVYQNSNARYTFPTLREARQILGNYLTESACVEPSYELGGRCPTLLFTRH